MGIILQIYFLTKNNMKYTVVSNRVRNILVENEVISDDTGSYQVNDSEYVINKKENEVSEILTNLISDYSLEEQHQINCHELYTTETLSIDDRQDIKKSVIESFSY